MNDILGVEEYQADDEEQTAYTYTFAPRGGGYDILHEHPDGSMPCRSGALLLGICHGPMDVSSPMALRLGA